MQMPSSCYHKPYPIYEVVTILRCLALKQSAPQKWKKLRELEAHEGIRKKNGRFEWFRKSSHYLPSNLFRYEKDVTTMLRVIREFLKVPENIYTNQEVMWLLQ